MEINTQITKNTLKNTPKNTSKNTSKKTTNIIKQTKGYSYTTNQISTACNQCISGNKSVLFITGKCNKTCFYCPISELKKDQDKIWINEKEINQTKIKDILKEIIEEIKLCNSKGIGITGGEPLLKLELCTQIIKELKKEFKKNFNIHLYTCQDKIKKEDLEKLYNSGLDEIRFHKFKINETIISAKQFNWNVTIEIPLLPKENIDYNELIQSADKHKINYINLNELEFSDTNADEMEKRGYELTDDELYSVKESNDLAQKILNNLKPLKHTSIHYCTSKNKYDCQYWNRLKNRAKNIKQNYEILMQNGLIKKGIIQKKENETLEQSAKKLNLKKYKILKKDAGYRIETSLANAKFAAKKGYTSAEVLEIPSANPFDIELTFFDKKGKLME
jgi:uncharacterized protein